MSQPGQILSVMVGAPLGAGLGKSPVPVVALRFRRAWSSQRCTVEYHIVSTVPATSAPPPAIGHKRRFSAQIPPNRPQIAVIEAVAEGLQKSPLRASLHASRRFRVTTLDQVVKVRVLAPQPLKPSPK